MKPRTISDIKVEIATTEKKQKEAEHEYAKNSEKLAELYEELEDYEGRNIKSKWDKVRLAMEEVLG